MAKKSNSTPKTPVAPAVPLPPPTSAKPKAAEPKPRANGDGKREGKAPASKAVQKPVARKTKIAAPKVPARKVTPAAAKPKARKPKVITQDQIALRAYFIAEKRQKEGLAGDAHQDWIEAERQLKEGR